MVLLTFCNVFNNTVYGVAKHCRTYCGTYGNIFVSMSAIQVYPTILLVCIVCIFCLIVLHVCIFNMCFMYVFCVCVFQVCFVYRCSASVYGRLRRTEKHNICRLRIAIRTSLRIFAGNIVALDPTA